MNSAFPLNSVTGRYKARFRSGNSERTAFFTVEGSKITGANVDQPISHSGTCMIDSSGLVTVEIRPKNNSNQPVEMVTGAILYPGEEYIFGFTGTLRDLGTNMTFNTPFGRLQAFIERVE